MRRAFALSAAALFGVSTAAALDLPARRPGLWEIKMSFEQRNMPAQTSQHCIDAESDRMMNAMGTSIQKDMCAKQDTRRVGDTIVVDSVCKFGETTTSSHGVISGDFNSAYTVKVDSKREGGPPLPGSKPGQVTRMTLEAKWLGVCKAGQKPGDVIMSNGMRINVIDMQKAGTGKP